MEAASIAALPYRGIWAVDFEYHCPPGERPDPSCLVALELRSGKKVRLWRDQFGKLPPYPTDADVLFVSYLASAELNCHRVLGWAIPERILDLYVEFSERTNGLARPAGRGLIGALIYFGLPHTDAAAKDEMRDKFTAGKWDCWDIDEREAGLDYCQTDVEALAHLLPAMLPRLDLPHALLRGRYMAAVSAMEHHGIPIDVETLRRLKTGWEGIQDRLIEDIDQDYGVYDGRTFKRDRFEAFLQRARIPWPRLESGVIATDDDTFKQAAKVYPIISPLRELRHSLSDMRLSDLAVGSDGRNRCMLSPFASVTSRNQPSNTRYIFGPSVWLRALIKPPPGYGVAYIDWAQQEFAIAAALSKDPAMMAAYMSGDPYLAFAKQAGAVPTDATGEEPDVKIIRELFKRCVLGLQYGMGPVTLAQRIEGLTRYPKSVARDLVESHRKTFHVFWRWSDNAVDHAMLYGWLSTVFGWRTRASTVRRKVKGRDEDVGPNPRSLQNNPMQSNGSEMMRLAACLATECGIEVAGPVHDAFLITAPLDRLNEDVARMRAYMAQASRVVCGGFELRTDEDTIEYPARYMDKKRGEVMWTKVMGLLEEERACVRA